MTHVDPAQYRVVTVDDDPTTIVTIQGLLEPEGYRVTGIQDPVEASERLSDEPFDVLLADQRMPNLDGLSLLRRAKLIRPDSMRIMLTGAGDYELAVAAINQGEVYRFLSKPIDEVELKLNVRLACERLALVREVERLRHEMKRRDQLLERLEQKNPGITEVTRRDDGAVVIEDPEAEPE